MQDKPSWNEKTKHGKSATFVPDYDMDKARALLLEFQELRDDRGVSLKDNYRQEGFNWYPTMVSYLFWYLFFPCIKYAPLVADWMDGRTVFSWKNDGQFRTLFTKSPVKRIGRDRFIRNVLYAIGNSGDPSLAAEADRLLGDLSPTVRGAAIWALWRLLPPLQFAELREDWFGGELDPQALEEWFPDKN